MGSFECLVNGYIESYKCLVNVVYYTIMEALPYYFFF